MPKKTPFDNFQGSPLLVFFSKLKCRVWIKSKSLPFAASPFCLDKQNRLLYFSRGRDNAKITIFFREHSISFSGSDRVFVFSQPFFIFKFFIFRNKKDFSGRFVRFVFFPTRQKPLFRNWIIMLGIPFITSYIRKGRRVWFDSIRGFRFNFF